VHCWRGADRTGAVIAAYRIDHDHWDNSRALKEALSCGMSFFQFPRQSYIRRFRPLTPEVRSEVINCPRNQAELQPMGVRNRWVDLPSGWPKQAAFSS
jgi:hypothetical protein